MKYTVPKTNELKKSSEEINLGKVSWLKKRTIPPQNIVVRLFERSINKYPRTHYQSYRKFYQTITPNFTVCNVKKPPCFLRKFSPCGRFLLAFSADQTSVEIYDYLGAAAATELMNVCPMAPGTTVLHRNVPAVAYVQNRIFDSFFRLRSSVHATTNQQQLNRECSLFTSDGKYIIVASASCRDAAAHGRLADAYRTNESVTPNPRAPLDDCSLHLIDIESGILCDSVTFKHDKIFLSHNQGLSLYGSMLVVLSVQHQMLHLYHVTSNGKFVALQIIGRVCYVDDDVLLNSCIAHDCPHLRRQQQSYGGDDQQQEDLEESEVGDVSFPPQASTSSHTSQQQQDEHSAPGLPEVESILSTSSSSSSSSSSGGGVFNSSMFNDMPGRLSSSEGMQSVGWMPPMRRQPVFPNPVQRPPAPHDHSEGTGIIYSLKHRFLVFMYRLSVQQGLAQGSKEPMRQFCASFDTFLHLRMLKMQLLDEKHLLIKYASEDVVTLRSSEPNCQPSYFVIYNIDAAEIVAVYDNSCSELMELYEQFTDYFRNARLPCEPHYLCSPANNIYARQLHERHKATLISSRGGGVTEASRRLLAQLPVACQAFSPSPYLDLDLFMYQDEWVSVMERPKTAADHHIRFYGRDSGLLKFSLEAGGRLMQSLSVPLRRLVAFTFHPHDPFAISVQKHVDDYVVNFHVRYVT